MNRPGLSRRVIAASMAGGAVHAVLALWLQSAVRGQSFREVLVPAAPSGVVFLSITVLGLGLLGGVPVALAIRNGLVAPLAGLVVLASIAFWRSWRYFADARAAGASSIDPHLDSVYVLLWIVPLAIVGAVGAVEYLIRRRLTAAVAGTDPS